MAGKTNIRLWDEAKANQESDASYEADAQRSGGATTDAIFFSPTGNKLFYQCSLVVAALAYALAGKGYAVVDQTTPETDVTSQPAAVSALAAVLANILTNADLPTILNNTPLTGVPTCPTPAVPGAHDDDTTIVNSAFVQNLLATLVGATPVRSLLGSPVTVPLNTQTNILTASVTFPSTGAAWRADIRYSAFVRTGGNVAVTAVKDASGHVFAACSSNYGGVGYGCHTGAEISANTYAPGSTVIFTLIANGNAGGGYPVNPNGYVSLSPNPQTFLEVTPVLA